MDISDSVQRILARDTVVADLFYARYLDDYPQVQRFFESVDLKDQAALLMMALLVIAQNHHHECFATRQYLKLLGRRHAGRKIPAALFPQFSQCLLETLARFHGDDWDANLASQWQGAFDRAIDVMRTGYDSDWVG